MKRYVLDANILIKDPSIIRKWSSNYRIIIPNSVLQEANYVSSRLTGTKDLISSIENLTTKGFLQIVDINDNAYPVNEALLADFKISYVDFLIANYTKDLSKEKKDTFLVTEDRRLNAYANRIGVKTLNLAGFQGEVLSNKTIDVSNIGSAKSITRFQFKHLAISFIAGILLTLISYYIYKNFQSITDKYPVWTSITFFSVIPFIFYWFRSNLRIAYAIAEFSFGYFTVMYVLKPLADDFDVSKIYDLTVAIPIIGGIYVMVRGLDNFSKGIQGTLLERHWKKIFKD